MVYEDLIRREKRNKKSTDIQEVIENQAVTIHS
jgi:hypothetical protein